MPASPSRVDPDSPIRRGYARVLAAWVVTLVALYAFQACFS